MCYVDPKDTVANGSSTSPNFAQFDSNPQTSNTALCKQIFNGHVPSGQYLQTEYIVCDEFLYLQAALKGQTAVTPQTLLAGVKKLANSYQAVAAY